MVKYLKQGIKIMVRGGCQKDGLAYILANPPTVRGYIILRLRGYKVHTTIFGNVLRKDFTKNKV